MAKELPNVFANPINKEFNNNESVFYSGLNTRSVRDVNVNKKINEIFASTSHVYKSNVKLTTSNGLMNATVVGKSGNYLLTLTGQKININDILDIEKI